MIRTLRAGVLTGTLVACCALSLAAQSSPPIYSIGQPPKWRQQATLQGAAYSGSGQRDVAFSYGVYHALHLPPSQAFHPVLGLIGGTAEAYGSTGDVRSAGVRAFLTSRMLATSAGADWDIRNHRVDAIFSWQSAILRGGLLGHGSMLRVDWLPTRDRIARVGIVMPTFDPLAGRTRPHATTVAVPLSPSEAPAPSERSDEGRDLQVRPSAVSVDPALATKIAEASAVIVAYSNLYDDDAIRATSGMTYAAAMQQSREALVALFAATPMDSGNARLAAARARTAVLDRIVIPVDSVFGRAKHIDVAGLARGATADFDRWLRDSSSVPPNSIGAARAAFQGWLGAVTPPMRQIVARAGDTRLIWLPLDLALTLDDYDEQIEVDSLIGRMVGHPFTDRNALTYMRNTDLPIEIARSILAAREYHVLWTHEFMGRLWESRAIDDIGYEMVADAYLPALTAAVKRYDSTGVFTMYMMLHDQFYYEVSDGRLWLTILEDPLNAAMHLRGDSAHVRERHLLERQRELRAAVAGSARLQRDARASGNAQRWLRNTVKVHVNVGNQTDFSFRSSHIIPGLPFAPDNLMRDHRKLVIYDLNEADPYRGALFVVGIGIGEVYASATWEDRGFRLRGPATLEARGALRRTLLRNGFSENDIPVPLRAVASTRAQEKLANLGTYVGRALQVHNDVGFGDKKSSIARAMLYNLTQPGTLIIVPDQLWMSETWAGMLAGAAARGARVHIIAPSQANAPIPDALAMARAYDVLLRLLHLRDTLGTRMRASGGDLRVGLFAALAAADNAPLRLREVRAGLTRYPWIRDVIPFDDQTLAVLDRVERETSADKRDATAIAKDEKEHPPQPHRKTQIVARPGAIAALLRQPGWDDVLADAMRVQSRQTADFVELLGLDAPQDDTAATRRADEILRGYEASIPEAERKRVSFYFAEGSHNMDQRGLMSDGEAMLIVSGPQASVGLVDLFYMMARTTWIDDEAGLNRLLPPRSGLIHRLARRLRATL